MKEVFSLILAFTMCLSLCSCGHTHKFCEWSTVKEPTCLECGSRIRTCECGETETEEIPVSDHNFNETAIIKAVTCEEDGETEMTCTVCGLVENKTVPTTGHSFEPATNFKPRTCSVCGTTEGKALAKVIAVGDTVESEKHNFVVKTIKFTHSLKESRGWTTYYYSDFYCLAIKLDLTNLSTYNFERWNSDRITNIGLEYQGKYHYEGDYWIPVDSIIPLDTDTFYICYKVPESMENDKSSSIYVTFTIDGETYAMSINDSTEN